MTEKKLLKSALAGVISLGFASIGSMAEAKPTWAGYEKCFGVSKKGQNDCGTSVHGCAGKAKADNDKTEWVYMPKGLCGKISGGKVGKGK